jgi:hypothetical protein
LINLELPTSKANNGKHIEVIWSKQEVLVCFCPFLSTKSGTDGW